MALQLIKVSNSTKDKEKLYNLANEAFPSKQEYLNPDKLIEMQSNNEIEYFSIYDEDVFIGFIVTKLYKKMVYLFFFAIEKSLRNNGYGSKSLQLLKEHYQDKIQTVDLELVDESAPNNKQRISRRKFYLRNGYLPTGKGLEYLDTKYEILCADKNFDINLFKEMISCINLKGFKPVYFDITFE